MPKHHFKRSGTNSKGPKSKT